MPSNRIVLFGVLVALNAFDVITTKFSLDMGATEANPLIGSNIIIIIAWKVIVLAIIGYLLVQQPEGKRWVDAVLLATIIIYAVVVGVNIGGIACLNA
jgi:hypothetical protein